MIDTADSILKVVLLRMAKEDEKKQPKTKRAKIEMKTASNSIQDSMTNVDVSCVPNVSIAILAHLVLTPPNSP